MKWVSMLILAILAALIGTGQFTLPGEIGVQHTDSGYAVSWE